jgi:hypothetical protein
LSSYFGIADPIWLRLIFALLLFAAGTGVLFYILLWIIIPKAQSTSDRLAMKGEPININNIAKEVNESINNLGSKINEFGQEFGQKKNKFANSSSGLGTGLANFLNELMDAIKYILPKMIKAFFILVGLIILIAIVGAGIGVFTSGFFVHDFTDVLFGQDLMNKHWLLILSAVLFFLLPAIILLILGIKTFFKVQTPKGLITGIGIFWILNIFVALGSGFNLAKSFTHSVETNGEKNYFSNINPDTLIIDVNEGDGFSDFEFDGVQFGYLKTKNDRFYSDDIRIKALKSEDSKISWKIDFLANGTSNQEAEKLSKSISYQAKQDGKRLIFPRYFEIEKGKVWRNQRVRVFVYIPEGKFCKITKRAEELVTKLEKDPDQDDEFEYSNTIWRMGKAGFINTKKPEDVKEDASIPKADSI